MNKRILSGLVALSICAGLGTMVSNAAKLGDVNNDNNIDIEDAVAVINNVNGVTPLTKSQEKFADVDGSGRIDIEDAVKIIANINGVTPLPDVDISSVIDDEPTKSEDSSEPDELDHTYANQEKADYIAKCYYNTLGTYFTIEQDDNGRSVNDIIIQDFKNAVSVEGIKAGKTYIAKGDKELAADRSVYNITDYNGTVFVEFDISLPEPYFPFYVRWVSPDGVMGQYPPTVEKKYDPVAAAKQKAANDKAKEFYGYAEEYIVDQETMGRKDKEVVDDGDFGKASSLKGLVLGSDPQGEGDKYLNESNDDYDGSVFIGFQQINEYGDEDFFIQYMDVDGTIGQYPTPPAYEYSPIISFGTFWEPTAKDISTKLTVTGDMVKDANNRSSFFLNRLCEYIAQEETQGRSLATQIKDGDFAAITSERGLKLSTSPEAKGDKFIAGGVSIFDKYTMRGKVYVAFEKNDDGDYDFFLQYADKDGAVGQCPTPPEFEDRSEVKFGKFWNPSAESIARERPLTPAMVKDANSMAKIYYNEAMEYISDAEYEGRQADDVFTDGDFKEANSQSGLKFAGAHTAKGDLYFCNMVFSRKFDKYTERCTVYFGKSEDTGYDEWPYFVQWITKDGAIGQYPSPISYEDNTKATFGTFYKK